MARAKTIVSTKIQNGRTPLTIALISRGKARVDVMTKSKLGQQCKRFKISNKSSLKKAYRHYLGQVQSATNPKDLVVVKALAQVKLEAGK